jgi:hypothetical protein
MDDDNYTRITFRMPKQLHAKLQEAATTTSKSMNAEIIARLDSSFTTVDQAPPASALAHLDRSLAQAQFENGQLEFQLSVYSKALMAAASVVRKLADPSNKRALELADAYERQAQAYVPKDIQAIEAELRKKIDELSKTASQISQLNMFEPDVILQHEDGSITVIEAKRPNSFGPVPPASNENTTKPRIRRSVKKTEK